MALKYRTDDATRWGDGIGRNLTPAEVDMNWWEVDQRLEALEARPLPSAGILDFEIEGDQLTILMTDLTEKGPYTLPKATYRARGAYTPGAIYALMDTFTANGSLYEVIYPHTAAATFDPDANDGLGHNFYSEMIPAVGNSLPTGGAIGQVLTKSTADDFAATWGWKFPTGTIGQYLRKASGDQDDVEFGDIDASEVGFTPATGSPLDGINNIADAVEAAAALGGSGASALADLTDVVLATEVPPVGSLLAADGDGNWVQTDSPNANDLMQFDGFGWSFISFDELMADVTFADIGGSPSLTQLRNQTVTALAASGVGNNVDQTLGNMFSITPTGDTTLTALPNTAGAEIQIFVLTSGTTSYNITFGTNFKSAGVLATGTVTGKNWVISFKSRAGFFYETSRVGPY